MLTNTYGSDSIPSSMQLRRGSITMRGARDWVIARFGPDDDIAAEMPTLKAWMVQSYCAIAPKKFASLVRGDAP